MNKLKIEHLIFEVKKTKQNRTNQKFPQLNLHFELSLKYFSTFQNKRKNASFQINVILYLPAH